MSEFIIYVILEIASLGDIVLNCFPLVVPCLLIFFVYRDHQKCKTSVDGLGYNKNIQTYNHGVTNHLIVQPTASSNNLFTSSSYVGIPGNIYTPK